MKVIRHMSCNIAGLIRNTGKKSMKGFMSDDGREMSNKEVRAYLQDCLNKGYKVIPLGNCEGFDYQTGCPGHLKEEDKEELKCVK
jgi:hypothetical protein